MGDKGSASKGRRLPAPPGSSPNTPHRSPRTMRASAAATPAASSASSTSSLAATPLAATPLHSAASHSSTGSPAPSSTTKVQVAVRVRPMDAREHAGSFTCIVSMDGNDTHLVNPNDGAKKSFTFDHSMWSANPTDPHFVNQSQVFERVGQHVVENSFEGYNGCIFAYGQTGSGKTHTMMGQTTNEGIIPRLCGTLFERIKLNDDVHKNFKVEVSYMQIYNEKVQDLLTTSQKQTNLRVREHSVMGPYVEGLSKLAVTNYDSVAKLMAAGNKMRSTASTNMNATSSRSHAVFTLVLTQAQYDPASKQTGEKVSRISLVDLAGSERVAKTGSTGERLREGANINKSLTTLGRVISALAEQASRPKSKETFIPYRDSVLTYLLRDSLGGNSKTVMVATISPASDNYDETLSTLRYADRAKQIINHAVVNEDPNARLIRELREELERLRAQVGSSGTQSTSEVEALRQRLMETEGFISEMTQSWEEKLKASEAILAEKQKLLDDHGAEVTGHGDRALSVDSKLPHFLSLSTDPLAAGVTLYTFKENEVTRIGPENCDPPNDILIWGPGTEDSQCFVTFQVEKSDEYNRLLEVIKLNPEGSLCAVDNEVIVEPTVLHHGNVITLGHTNVFRFNHPTEAQLMREGLIAPRAQSSSSLAMNFNAGKAFEEKQREEARRIEAERQQILKEHEAVEAAKARLAEEARLREEQATRLALQHEAESKLRKQQEAENEKLRQRLAELEREREEAAKKAEVEREKLERLTSVESPSKPDAQEQAEKHRAAQEEERKLEQMIQEQVEAERRAREEQESENTKLKARLKELEENMEKVAQQALEEKKRLEQRRAAALTRAASEDEQRQHQADLQRVEEEKRKLDGELQKKKLQTDIEMLVSISGCSEAECRKALQDCAGDIVEAGKMLRNHSQQRYMEREQAARKEHERALLAQRKAEEEARRQAQRAAALEKEKQEQERQREITELQAELERTRLAREAAARDKASLEMQAKQKKALEKEAEAAKQRALQLAEAKRQTEERKRIAEEERRRQETESQVQNLHEATDCPLAQCRAILIECGGDMTLAADRLFEWKRDEESRVLAEQLDRERQSRETETLRQRLQQAEAAAAEQAREKARLERLAQQAQLQAEQAERDRLRQQQEWEHQQELMRLREEKDVATVQSVTRDVPLDVIRATYIECGREVNATIERLYQKQEEEEGLKEAMRVQNEEMAQHSVASDPTVGHCILCNSDARRSDCLILSCCDHKYHRSCLLRHIKAEVDAGKYPLHCPTRGCEAQLTAWDVELHSDQDTYAKFNRLQRDFR